MHEGDRQFINVTIETPLFKKSFCCPFSLFFSGEVYPLPHFLIKKRERALRACYQK